MKMTLDIGKNLHNTIAKQAKSEGIDDEHFAINMMELGLRVYASTRREKKESVDPNLKFSLENNALLKEIIRCVFDKGKIVNKVLDAATLITLIENNASSYLRGLSDA